MNAREAADLCPAEQDARNTIKTQFGHEHTFEFLREERTPKEQWGERVHSWIVWDIFYCAGCLEYQRIKVQETSVNSYSLGEVVTWRKS